MAKTYEPIATTTLGSAASSITFSSIPATYTDLRLVFTATSDSASRFARLRFNSDTGANYSMTEVYGTGSAAGSARSSGDTFIFGSNYGLLSTSNPAMMTWDIFSYAGSTNKTTLAEFNGDYNGSGNVERFVHLWRSTSAITSIELSINAGNFASGSSATLYGILKA